MLSPIQHPVFGRLVPDQWSDSLICFRQFPHLKSFWLDHSKQRLEDLEPGHRKLVSKWEDQPEGLAKICREFDVLAALQSLGVYEVGIGSVEDSEDRSPTEAQVEAFQFFQAHEEAICQNICRELLNYYSFLREHQTDLFTEEESTFGTSSSDEVDASFPESPETVDELANCIRFDGMTLTSESIGGAATISLGWDVDWDIEHGLQTVLHKGQPIAFGSDLYGPDDVVELAEFSKQFLSDPAKNLLTDFCRKWDDR